MDKKQLSMRDICRTLISPALRSIAWLRKSLSFSLAVVVVWRDAN